MFYVQCLIPLDLPKKMVYALIVLEVPECPHLRLGVHKYADPSPDQDPNMAQRLLFALPGSAMDLVPQVKQLL